MSITHKIQKFLYGNQTNFRLENAGENEFEDLQNIKAYQNGIYKMIFEKYADQNNSLNLPYISNHKYSLLQIGSMLGILGFVKLSVNKNFSRGLILLAMTCFHVKLHYVFKKHNIQRFLLINYDNFTPNEQKALLTGDARYFQESFGDLKNENWHHRKINVI